jgi:hypothetical protein
MPNVRQTPKNYPETMTNKGECVKTGDVEKVADLYEISERLRTVAKDRE